MHILYTALLMEAVLKLPDSLLDDQIRINKALEAVHPTWINIDVANTTMYACIHGFINLPNLSIYVN